MSDEQLPDDVREAGGDIETLLLRYDDLKMGFMDGESIDLTALLALWSSADAVIERMRVLIDYAVMLDAAEKLDQERGWEL